MDPIYLDYNATTPIDHRVAEAMLPFIHQYFGNPSSSHSFGIITRKAVEKARRQVADLLHCRTDEVIFTSGGTESNNYAIKGIALALKHKGNHIITSSIEHFAVLEVCRYLEKQGYVVTYLPVDKYGLVNPQAIEKAVRPQTILISIMHANNEVGTIEPMAEIAEIAHRYNILLHSDCAQSIGKIPVLVDELKVDLLSVAGHKLYAPKGIGALYIRSGVVLEKLMHGANHEMRRRAGTENVSAIVALGCACELIGQDVAKSQAHLKKMRNRLEEGLKKKLTEGIIQINGHPKLRLPNTSSISFKALRANIILSELKGIAASAGAACHSDHVKISHVLEAMHVPREYAMGTIRFSIGRFTTPTEIDQALNQIAQGVGKLLSAESPEFTP